MSVQAGIWNLDGNPIRPELLKRFSVSLKERGPDGESCYVNGSIALLYRPFHTTAESRREQQPYVSRRGFIITWDGRLDNRDELIFELRNELQDDSPDVAVVATAFEQWEADCFHRIVGDWAISIWQPQQRELTFAVDHMAIRHIFYYAKKDQLWWSTDIAPLVLLSGDTFHIDDEYIVGYFGHEPLAHLTPYQEIRKVPPGQFVRVRDGGIRIDSHRRLKPTSPIRYRKDAEYEEHFRHLFRQSVGRRLRSDSPILAELSGGLDSSSIVCVADEIVAKGGWPARHLDTLSYYDKTEPHGDDWNYFQKVEAHRGHVGHHIDCSKSERSCSSLQYSGFLALPGQLGVGRHVEEQRAQIVRNGGYRAVLSGIGGDEFMGGIPNPIPQLADCIVQLNAIRLARQLFAWSLVKRKPWVQLLWEAAIALLPPSLVPNRTTEGKIRRWIRKDFAKRIRVGIRGVRPVQGCRFWLPSRRWYASGLLLMACKMANFVPWRLAPEETRYPYLDQDLLEFLLCIPANQLLRPGERRSLLRRSLTGVVPQEILDRRTKQVGTRTPIVILESNLEELQRAFDSSLSSRLGYVDDARFIEELSAARAGKEIHILRMLRTISLEFWLRDLVARGLIDIASRADASLPATALAQGV